MSSGPEILLAVLGGGSALTAIGTGVVKFGLWILKRLIREEITPALETLTREVVAMRTSSEHAQQTQASGARELHEALAALQHAMEQMALRMTAVESTAEVLEIRVATLEEEAS